MKNKVVILGAGMVVQPVADYLLDNDVAVTIASRTLEKAKKAIHDHPNGWAMEWTIEDLATLEELVKDHDLVVSLLPYTHHVTVAKFCIKHKTNMLTTSYVSDEMQALDKDAKEAGIIIVNEIGVDPGFDHMTAMQVIDSVHAEGGKVDEFYSLCGALAAPETLDNPLKYKFTWSPKGVVMAGNNDARYLEGGKEKYKPTEDLFKDPLTVNVPEVGKMEVYPNRNSMPYIDLYGIPEAQTIYRGTVRYVDWCEAFDVLKAMGWTSYDQYDLKGKSYADFTADICELESTPQLRADLADKYHLSTDSPALRAMDFLGLLSNDPVHLDKASPFDVISDIMIERMMLAKEERDMVVMQHMFKVKKANGELENIKLSLLDFGDRKYTSIAKTVGYPAAIGVKMILDGRIKLKGVQIPTKKEIYIPVLDELKKMGISMQEEHEVAY